MRGIFPPLGVLFALLRLSQQVTEQDPRDYYVGAVVEFAPRLIKDNGSLTLQENTKLYRQFINDAKQQGADIIVFPEDGITTWQFPGNRMDLLTTVIPSPEENFVPCTQNKQGVSETLKQLSCAARENKIYLVVNIAEKEYAEGGKESTETTIYHNSNVVFDRTGKIIARYRKVNLYNEARFTAVNPPEIVIFETDFNVKFGTFICFDVLFAVPALNLTRLNGVRDIVFPTAWFSETPFLTAVQAHYGWSYSENVNMLVAGYNNPASGNSGSGIFLGRDGIANATMAQGEGHYLLVSRIPKKTGPSISPIREPVTIQQIPSDESPNQKQECYAPTGISEEAHGLLLIRESIRSFKSFPLRGTLINETVCHQGLCCMFQIEKTEDTPPTNYRGVVYNGCRLFGTIQLSHGIRVCGLTQCSNDSIASCGSVVPSTTIFKRINITVPVPDLPRVLAFPSVLNSSLLPSDHWTYREITWNNDTFVRLGLDQPLANLSSFAVFIRDFAQDGNGVASIAKPSLILLMILVCSVLSVLSL